MTAFLQRLQARMPDAPYEITEDNKWQFNEFLDGKKTAYFKPLIKDHAAIGVEYSILCAELAANFMREDAHEQELTEQVTAALMLAELLIFIYQHYLAVPREVARLRKDQQFYRRLLRAKGFEFADDLQSITPVKPDKLSQHVRYATSQLNWARMFVVRVKRVLDSLVPIIKSIEQYRHWVEKVNRYANPFFAYLSWLFFGPRLADNSTIMFKHVVPSSWWMSKREQELPWFFRFVVTLSRRWFEMGNDVPWVALGLVNCFLLTGSLAPIGAYITVALFGYDVLLAGLRAHIELNRLFDLRAQYAAIEDQLDNPYERQELQRLQKGLEALISYEKKRLALSVFNATALFFAMILTIPALTFNPLFPLLAGGLLVAITVLVYTSTKALEKRKPQDSVQHLETANYVPGLRFFGVAKVARQPLDDKEIEMKEVETYAYEDGLLISPL